MDRRSFLIRSAHAAGGAWLTSMMPSILEAHEHAQAKLASGDTSFAFFTPAQAVDVEAIAAQIIPTDDTPGAREAGVIHFIDAALSKFEREKQADYTAGLTQLTATVKRLYPDDATFSTLSSDQQIKLLHEIESSDFFKLVRLHTICGFFADPKYGGNRDNVGQKLYGIETAMVFSPPFGEYDQ